MPRGDRPPHPQLPARGPGARTVQVVSEVGGQTARGLRGGGRSQSRGLPEPGAAGSQPECPGPRRFLGEGFSPVAPSFADSKGLSNPAEVEALREKVYASLEAYCKHKYPEQPGR